MSMTKIRAIILWQYMWAIADNTMFTEGFVLPAARSYERSEGEMSDNGHPMLQIQTQCDHSANA